MKFYCENCDKECPYEKESESKENGWSFRTKLTNIGIAWYLHCPDCKKLFN